jgi:hypothetical protein
VDFKEKHDGNHARLEDNDKKNLAKAVSGFANSSGGVLIWGVEDKTLAPKPITDAGQFTSSMLHLASQVTDPCVQGIDGDWIPSNMASGDAGFALVYIPESQLPPHRVISNISEVKNHYYIRTGDSFVVASHVQLEDMFGRRPKPRLELTTRPKSHGSSGTRRDIWVIIGIKNTGRGIARFPFLSISIWGLGKISERGIDASGNFGLRRLAKSIDSTEYRYGSSEVVIYPDTPLDVTVFEVTIDMEQLSDSARLVIDYEIAAEGIMPIRGRNNILGSDLLKAILH